MLRAFHLVWNRVRQTITEPHRFEGIEGILGFVIQPVQYPFFGLSPRVAACQWGEQQHQQVAASPAFSQIPVFAEFPGDRKPSLVGYNRIGTNIPSGGSGLRRSP